MTETSTPVNAGLALPKAMQLENLSEADKKALLKPVKPQEGAHAPAPEVILPKVSLVAYCDGGANPNPGFGGWGLHGYTWIEKTNKKGAGNNDVIPTARGYVPKKDEAAATATEVEVMMYFDGFQSYPPPISNNVGEVEGLIAGLKLALEYNVEKVLLYTDSKYAQQGFNEWVEGWVKRNWIKADGQPVANSESWRKVVALKKELIMRGIVMECCHVYGHSGDLGNEIADLYASLSVRYSASGDYRCEMQARAPSGYWKYDSERHPFLSSACMYFNTDANYLTKGVYYTGSHGKDDEMIGARMGEGAYSMVRIDTPDPVIETIRAMASNLANAANLSTLMFGRLDPIFSPDTHRSITAHGEMALSRRTANALDLVWVKERLKPLVTELDSAKIAWRAVEAIDMLCTRLAQFKNGEANIVTTDLTDTFFETIEVKKGKAIQTSLQLMPVYNVGFAKLSVQANYQAKDGIKQCEVPLVLGIDLPNRNALKRTETLAPKVTLLTWRESEEVFRYAAVIQANGCEGIWAGCYSNYRFLKPEQQ